MAILFRVGMDMLDMHVGLLLEPLGVIHVTNMVLVISMKGVSIFIILFAVYELI